MNAKDVDFPKLVRARRKAMGLNQTELAERAGNHWTQRIVSRIEQGQEPTLRQAFELDSVLQIGVFVDLSDGYDVGYRAGIEAARELLAELNK